MNAKELQANKKNYAIRNNKLKKEKLLPPMSTFWISSAADGGLKADEDVSWLDDMRIDAIE